MSNYAVVVSSDLPRTEAVVDPQKIAAQIRDIVDQLGVVFTEPLGLPLASMEVSLTLTAEGSVGFLGTGGSVSGEGSITLSFSRPE